MAKKRTTPKTQIAKFLKEMETAAKRLRADVRKRARAAGLDRKLHQAAAQLEKRTKTAVSHVRKHADRITRELAGTARKPAKKRRTKRKRKK